MDAFIQKFCEKYSLPIALSLQLLDNMEKFTFHKGCTGRWAELKLLYCK